MASLDPLARVYVDALCGRAIYVHVGLDGAASHIGFKAKKQFDNSATFWFAKSSHAELVMLRCIADFSATGDMRPDGWVDLKPHVVKEKIAETAALLGARFQTEKEIMQAAEKVAAAIVGKMESMRRNGDLGEINRQYKAYRLEKVAQGEKAMGYSAYISKHQKSLVIHAAKLASGEIMQKEPTGPSKWPATKKGRTDPGFTGWTPTRGHPKEW